MMTHQLHIYPFNLLLGRLQLPHFSPSSDKQQVLQTLTLPTLFLLPLKTVVHFTFQICRGLQGKSFCSWYVYKHKHKSMIIHSTNNFAQN